MHFAKEEHCQQTNKFLNILNKEILISMNKSYTKQKMGRAVTKENEYDTRFVSCFKRYVYL